MKRFYRCLQQIIAIIMVAFLLLQSTPLLGWAQDQTQPSVDTTEISNGNGAKTVNTTSSEEKTANTSSSEGETTDTTSSERETETTTTSESATNTSSSSEGETKNTTSSEEVTGSTDETVKQLKPKASAGLKRQTRTGGGLIGNVTVTEWKILDSNAMELSTTNKANAGQAYDFVFQWSLLLPEGQGIVSNDFFEIDLPENTSGGAWQVSDGIWEASTNKSNPTQLYVDITEDEVTVKYHIGSWWIDRREDGSHGGLGTYFVRVEFGGDVDKKNINDLTGVEFNLGEGALRNRNNAGSPSLDVTFGPIIKQIGFNPLPDEISTGSDYKYSPHSGNNDITYDIGIGRASPLELAGDVVDYRENRDDGFYLDGAYHGFRWGENYSDLTNVFVEDKLTSWEVINPGQVDGEGNTTPNNLKESAEKVKGMILESLTISALIPMPLGLTAQDRDIQMGGMVSRNVSSYESYVLSDQGNGPVFRAPGQSYWPQLPKVDTDLKKFSFSLVEQTDNETIDEFRNKVKNKPFQYGVFTEETGKDATHSIMINVGDILKSEPVDTPRYQDLTDEEYATHGRTIKRIGGDVLNAEENIQITRFAEIAAQRCIANEKRYQESDREMLEDYFTLTYGESNVIGGRIAAFNISLKSRHRLDDDLKERKYNVAEAGYETALIQGAIDAGQTGEWVTMPIKHIGHKKMTNPYGRLAIDARTLMLFKFDSSTNREMNGVEFDLQKKNSATSSWEYVGTYITSSIKNNDDVDVDGVIRVSGLGNGIYRFVEKRAESGNPDYYPEGYNQSLSSNYDTNEERIISEERTINGSNSVKELYVENTPQETAPYVVEHYFKNTDTKWSEVTIDDFELRDVQNADGSIRMPIGTTVTARPYDDILGYKYASLNNGGEAQEVTSGEITPVHDLNASYNENGQLVLKLFYDYIDESITDIQKINERGEPMPSFDSDGKPIVINGKEQRVRFRIYQWIGQWGSDENPSGTRPEEGGPDREDIWKDTKCEFLTDSNGFLSGPPLKKDVWYLLVETETYDEYELISGLSNYWYFNSGDGSNGLTIRYMASKGENNPGHRYVGNEYPTYDGYYQLINRPKKGTVQLYKADEENNLMGSGSTATSEIKFQLYEYIGDKSDGKKPEDSGNFGDGSIWKPVKDLTVTESGKILDENTTLSLDTTYALVETQTHQGYYLEPNAYWLFTNELTDSGIKIDEVTYVGSQDPGILAPEDNNNPANGYFTIKNQTKPTDFTFIKENQEKEPLDGVDFKLYEIDSMPPDIDEILNNDNLLYSVTSSDGGKVTFTGLKKGQYLLVETKTLPDYDLPTGHWIIAYDPTQPTLAEQITITAIGDPLPPAFRTEGVDDEIKYFLPNYRGYNIPLTGGSGMMRNIVSLITIVGLGIFVIGYSRRKLFGRK